jgi:hypothetical protein
MPETAAGKMPETTEMKCESCVSFCKNSMLRIYCNHFQAAE